MIVIDDGSKEESQPIFVELKKDNIKVYKHEKTKERTS